MHRDELAHGLLDARSLRMAAANIGRKKTRRDGVDRDVVSGEFERDGTHQVRGTGFGRHVGRANRRFALISGDRGVIADIHDLAANRPPLRCEASRFGIDARRP